MDTSNTLINNIKILSVGSNDHVQLKLSNLIIQSTRPNRKRTRVNTNGTSVPSCLYTKPVRRDSISSLKLIWLTKQGLVVGPDWKVRITISKKLIATIKSETKNNYHTERHSIVKFIQNNLKYQYSGWTDVIMFRSRSRLLSRIPICKAETANLLVKNGKSNKVYKRWNS